MGWRRVYLHTVEEDRGQLISGHGDGPEPAGEADLRPHDDSDPQAMRCAEQVYLDRERALYRKLHGEPAAPYMLS